MNYAERVKYLREKTLKLTQLQFAELCGVHQTFISKVELGEKTFGRKKEGELVIKLGLPPGFFANEDVGATDGDLRILYSQIPGAEDIRLTWDDVRALVEPHVILHRRKLGSKSSD
jgi:transcriptional regulator with XRE-family HTH domain